MKLDDSMVFVQLYVLHECLFLMGIFCILIKCKVYVFHLIEVGSLIPIIIFLFSYTFMWLVETLSKNFSWFLVVSDF